ncbi:MAG: tetratricopeptide repeat protein, partial [bacterium]
MPALIFVRALGLLVLGQTESLPALINDTAAAVESLPRPVPHPAAADATSRILGMDPTLFWGLVATAVACVVGIIVAVCLYRRTASKRQVEVVQKDMATKDQVEGVRKDMCARIDALSTALGAQLYADGLPTASPPVRDPFKLGLTAMERYKWDEAIGHFKDAAKHASGTQLVALFNLIGICHYTPGRWPEALEDWEESERLARRFGDRKGEAAALGNIGVIWQNKGELDKALEYQEKALKVLEELGAKQEQASVLGNIGLIWQNKGELDKALGYQEKALKMRRELGMKLEEAQALGNIGLIWKGRGELDKALEYHEKSLAIDR